MGIGINVGSGQDSSYLFQGLSSSGSAGNLNFISDYASIKNGSYGKLMKAYYGSGTKQSSSAASSSSKSRTSNVVDRILEEKKNPKVSKQSQEANEKLTAGLSTLKTTVSTLRNSNTYTNTENGQSAADKVNSAVKDYVSNYNDVVKAAKSSTLMNKTAHVASVMRSTTANADKLSEIGITVNDDGTLSLNEAKLKSADVSKVQDLFSPDDIMSYGSVVASRLQFAGTSNSTSAAGSTTDSATVSGAAGLKADANALASDKLFEKIKDKDGRENYDIDKIFSTAKSFVNNYNKMFDVAESSLNSGVSANLAYIKEKTARNEDMLKQFGISVDEKGRMSINEDTFKNSDMSQVQDFFKNYGSSIATNASLVDYYLTTQANETSGYTNTGAYNVQGSAFYDDIM